MSDQCKYCTLRGKLKECQTTDCGHHDNWINQQLRAEIKELTNIVGIREDEVTGLLGINDQLRAELGQLQARYHDLVMQVSCKFQGEARHDTAKRYIVERENREVACCKEGDAEDKTKYLSCSKDGHGIAEAIRKEFGL